MLIDELVADRFYHFANYWLSHDPVSMMPYEWYVEILDLELNILIKLLGRDLTIEEGVYMTQRISALRDMVNN